MALDEALHKQQIATELELHRTQSSRLEERHRELEQALEAVRHLDEEPVLYCTGKPAFLQLSVGKARSLLRQEKNVVWEEIDKVQRAIAKLERRLEDLSSRG